MNLHEWQAQQILKPYDINVPQGFAAGNLDEALNAYESLGGGRVVVKAQVHAGGRGTAGGIRIVDSKASLAEVVKSLLGTRLVTYQTDKEGQPIDHVYLVKPCVIERELYVSAVVDRQSEEITFLVSSEGGVDIEKVASDHPEKIHRFSVDPLEGVCAYKCFAASMKLKLVGKQIKQFFALINNLYAVFVNHDLALLEINPLVIDDKGDLVCLDTKLTVDDNALYRQPTLRMMADPRQENGLEALARKWDLNYVRLEGNIGCMVNGAGLAMATMDMIALAGGSPANFLDVGGSVTKDRVKEAFKIIITDKSVKAIWINIFGGIVQCDMIAEGIIQAVAEIKTSLPVITRLEGNNAERGRKKFLASGLNILPADDFWHAAELVVAASKSHG